MVKKRKRTPAQLMNEKDFIFCLWILYNFTLQRGKMAREERVLYCLPSGSFPVIQIKYCWSECLSSPNWNQSTLSVLVVFLLMLSANFSQSGILFTVKYLDEIIKIPCYKPQKIQSALWFNKNTYGWYFGSILGLQWDLLSMDRSKNSGVLVLFTSVKIFNI